MPHPALISVPPHAVSRTTGLPLPRRPVAWLVTIGLAMLAVRVVFALRADPFPDEYLYAWLWSVEPLNFCPHPPGTPLLAALGMALGGRTGFGLKLMPLILGCLPPLLVYLLARSVAAFPRGGDAAPASPVAPDPRAVAFWAALFCLATPMYLAFGALLTPDGTQIVMWSVALLLTWRALTRAPGRATGWWLGAGVVVGLGLHVKYMMILYFPPLALCMLVVPAWRAQLRTAGPWLAVAAAGLVFGPLAALTEYRQDWPTLRYHLVSRQNAMSPSLGNVAEYQGGHLGMYSPILYPALVAALAVAAWRGWRRREPDMAFLGFFGGFMWLFFASIAVVTERELNREQWDAPAYVTAMVALALLGGRWLASAADIRARTRRLRLLAAGPVLGLVTIALVSVEVLTGVFTAAVGEKPLFRGISGWRAMASRADAEFRNLPADRPGFFLASRFSGALAYWFHGTATPRIYTLNHASSRQYGVEHLLLKHGLSEENLLAREEGNHAVYVYVTGSRRVEPENRRKRLLMWFEDAVIPEAGGMVGRCVMVRALRFHHTDNVIGPDGAMVPFRWADGPAGD